MNARRHRPLRFIAGLLFVAGLIAMSWPRVQVLLYERSRPATLPPAQPAEAFATKPVDSATVIADDPAEIQSPITNHQSLIPDSLNLDVPFASQAPHANWDAAHEEYCEEASAVMVDRFFTGRFIDGPDDADAALVELHRWQLDHLGHFESTTAEETAQMIREVYGLTVTLSTDVNELSIKRALAEGSLVIVPAAGRELGNPYFRVPGPIYHMLVVKGYTAAGQFITNDPGTRRGADFVYDEDRLLGAVGDYNHGDPATGNRVMLVVDQAQG